MKLWDPLKGTCLMTFNAHENWVRAVIFHPSFKYIISCSDDKTIRVLDIKVSLVFVVIIIVMLIRCCAGGTVYEDNL